MARYLTAFLWLLHAICGSSFSVHNSWGLTLGHLKTTSPSMVTLNSVRETREARRKDLEEGLRPSFDIEPTQVPLEEDPLVPVVKAAVKAADMRKAEDIVAFRVTDLTLVTEFKMICVGNSRPQNQAIAKAIEEDLQEQFGLEPRGEGKADSGWILLDYGDFIVHVMTPKSRAYYDLDGFWKNGERLDISDVILPNAGASSASSLPEPEEEEVDPFWS
mmetsp:Transcript_4175/g.6723  ORF Transcript_4175/g.6723 Transcript_4175/m.6723 type:complete len:218 (-) Transcript_4175:198-851(-)